MKFTLPLRLLLLLLLALPTTAQNDDHPPGTRFTHIAAGEQHSLALKADGTVLAWEKIWNGSDFVTATRPGGLTDVAFLVAGGEQSLALKTDGTLVAWGNSYPVPGGPNDVVALAAGSYHTLALKADGTVAAWGDNQYGQSTVPAGLTGVVAVAAGGSSGAGGGHSLALKGDGTVVAWGLNDQGQSTAPVGLTDVIGLAAGAIHSLALKSDGTVVAWGQIHNGSAWVPVTVPDGLKDAVALAAGAYHSLALVVRPPALVVQASGENISLAWPLSAQSFILQATTNLADETSWIPVLTVPVVEGSQNRVTEPVAGPAKFYRLMRP